MSFTSPGDRPSPPGSTDVFQCFFHTHEKITEPVRERKGKTGKTAVKLSLLLMLILFFCAPSDAEVLQEAFWSRNWKVMDSLCGAALSGDYTALSKPGVTSRDVSLYINALWIQRRYAEGLGLMEGAGGVYPPSLTPYAGMLSVLGMERTGRKQEALEAGKSLWPDAPEPIRYYLAYAVGRLERDASAPEEAIFWFRRMLAASGDRRQRAIALKEIVSLPGATAGEAAELLVEQPSNARALAICKAAEKGKSAKADYALGYYYYTRKSYAEAAERLALAYGDAQYGEAARYYHAYALFREKEYGRAFDIWSGVAQSGSDYPQRSVQRLISLARQGKKSDILRVFRKIAETRGDYPELAADGLAAIVRLGGEAQAKKAADELLKRFPATNQAAAMQWERGWGAWKEKNYRAAAEAWKRGWHPGIKNRELAARLLYWHGRALENLGDSEAMTRTGDLLARACPGEYHTFLVRPDGGLTSADIPASFVQENELEDWGFVTYARLESASAANAGNPAAQFRAVRLAGWEGDFASSVRAFALLAKAVGPGGVSSAALLRYAYPRAFEGGVSSAAGRTGLDPAIIWGVMRQESLYEADVTSSAGAFGLMQLMPGTAKEEAQKMKLPAETYKKPPGNILLGANHMTGLLRRYKDLPRALAAYNAGGAPVNRWSKEQISDMAEWIEDIPYNETRGYVKAVLRNVEAYRLLYRTK